MKAIVKYSLLSSLILSSLSFNVTAAPIDDLKDELNKLQAKVKQLEEQKSPGGDLVANRVGKISMYGVLDIFAEYNTGADVGSRTAIESGGVSGSRLGFKGNTQITNDLKGLFVAEAGFFANNGKSSQDKNTVGNSTGALFGRQIFAGVEGGFGQVTVGRQYTLLFNGAANYDPLGIGYGSPTNGGIVDIGVARIDSSVIYASPNMSGLTFNLLYAPGGQPSANDSSSRKTNLSSASVNYATGPLSLTAVYEGNKSATTKTTHYFAGASYKVGVVNLMGGATNFKNKDTSAKRTDWMLGLTADLTSTGQLQAGYGSRGKTKTNGLKADDKGNVMMLGWFEALNKSNNVYAVVSRHTNGSALNYAAGGTSSNDSYKVNFGESSTGLALGYQYKF